MTTSREFNYVSDLVCEFFEVDKDTLLSKCKSEDAVSARSLLCHILSYQGISAKSIARWTGLTVRCVNKHLARYYEKMSSDLWFANQVERARQRTRETCPFTVRVNSEIVGNRPRTN